MFKIFYFVATMFRGSLSPHDISTASVCIGERCNGDKVSAIYLQENHTISPNVEGYGVRSFQITYDDGANATRTVRIEGNDLGQVLPDLQALQSGSKFYVEGVVIQANDEPHSLRKTFVFRME